MSEGNTEIKLSYRLTEDGFIIYYDNYEYESKFDSYVSNESDLINYIKMLNKHIINVGIWH